MRFVTFIALAGLATSLCAHAAGEPPGQVRKREGVAVASPNRLPASQLAGGGRPVQVSPLGEGPWGLVLVDRIGRPIGRAHPGFITNEPLVAARLNGLATAIAGLAPEARCDGTRCQYGDALAWGTNAPVRLVYRSADCSGRPAVSYHPSAIGFEAIAFAVDEPEGRYVYQARSLPQDVLVGSWRRPGEPDCQRADGAEVEPVLPLEGVFPAALLGQAPLRWR